MTTFTLAAHPANPSSAIREVIAIPKREGDRLRLAFRALGDRDQVRWPTQLPIGFSDDLWRHSCFEAFVGVADDPGYVELNLAPSGRWAAYRFDGYRAGMQRAAATAEMIQWLPYAHDTLRATMHLPDLPIDRDWQLQLSAVIETFDGSRNYFALTHGPGNPDFHNRDCFIATLPARTGHEIRHRSPPR